MSKNESYSNADALLKLQEWDRKYYRVTIHTSGHIMHGDGYTVVLEGGKRKVEVHEHEMIGSDEDGVLIHPTLGDLIVEAIKQWHTDEKPKKYNCHAVFHLGNGSIDLTKVEYRSSCDSFSLKESFYFFNLTAKNEEEAIQKANEATGELAKKIAVNESSF